MTEALITIGITCFNEGDWLLECWNSVLDQTDDRWIAVMVLDGGANARTREIFDQLKHPKLEKIAMPKNVGPYPSRNKAFESTRTPYHFYLDGDDQLTPNAVELVLETFDRYPHAGFVYGDYECFGARAEIWRYPTMVKAEDLAEKQVTPGGCAYKLAMWNEIGGFASELARGNADYDFFISAFESGIRGYHCGDIFYRYRIGHSGKVSQSYNLKYHEIAKEMVRRHPRFFRGGRRRRFLALGYRRAALANDAISQSKIAARMALIACRYGFWRDRELQIILLKRYLPNTIFGGLQKAWRTTSGWRHQ